ncbi:MAG: hypothetical protein EAZ95_08535 [Bacteroidetes bacterium]|nr:MAG: hypothetical protein EAZ95_08535 [Bacteroidota bacterium]
MKKTFITFSCFCLFLFTLNACKNAGEATMNSPQKIAIKSYENANVTEAIKASGIHDFRLNKGQKTLADLEGFYHNLPSKYKNSTQLEALQGLTASMILEEYGLLDSQKPSDKQNIEKYVDVVRTTQYGTPSLYIKIIKTMRKHWKESKVNELKYEFIAIADSQTASIQEKMKLHENRINNPQTPRAEKVVLSGGLNLMRKFLQDTEELKNL